MKRVVEWKPSLAMKNICNKTNVAYVRYVGENNIPEHKLHGKPISGIKGHS